MINLNDELRKDLFLFGPLIKEDFSFVVSSKEKVRLAFKLVSQFCFSKDLKYLDMSPQVDPSNP